MPIDSGCRRGAGSRVSIASHGIEPHLLCNASEIVPTAVWLSQVDCMGYVCSQGARDGAFSSDGCGDDYPSDFDRRLSGGRL